MSNEKTKITWQCYPQNIESFESVNFPVVNDAIKTRQHYYEEVNHIDHLPNYEVPDNTGPVVNFQGPENNEPVRHNEHISMAPIIVMTDVEPGMIMPGNISVSLPQYMDEHPNYVYPNVDQEFNHDVDNSLHGSDVLNAPQVTNSEIHVDLPVPTQPVATVNQPFNLAKPNVETQPPLVTLPPVYTQAPVLDSVQAAIPLAPVVNSVLPVKQVDVVQAPKTVFKPVVSTKNTKHHHNKLLHKVLMYVAIALIIYLIYVILFEKN